MNLRILICFNGHSAFSNSKCVESIAFCEWRSIAPREERFQSSSFGIAKWLFREGLLQ